MGECACVESFCTLPSAWCVHHTPAAPKQPIRPHTCPQGTLTSIALIFIPRPQVWSKFACLPNFQEDFKGRVFVDILNEPDSQGQGWQQKENKAGERVPQQLASGGGAAQHAVLQAFAASARDVPSQGWDWRPQLDNKAGERRLQTCSWEAVKRSHAAPHACLHAPTSRHIKGMTELYTGVMDALDEMTPGLPIYFIEGGGQGGYKGAPSARTLALACIVYATDSRGWAALQARGRACMHAATLCASTVDVTCMVHHLVFPPGLNWGNGFITNTTIIKSLDKDWFTRISDANPFFK